MELILSNDFSGPLKLPLFDHLLKIGSNVNYAPGFAASCAGFLGLVGVVRNMKYFENVTWNDKMLIGKKQSFFS